MAHCGGTDCHGGHDLPGPWAEWQRRELGGLPCVDKETSASPPATGWSADSQYCGEDITGPILDY